MSTNIMPKIVVTLVVVLALVYIVNIINTTGLVLNIGEKVEQQKPANIEIIKLSDQSCPNCFNTDLVIQELTQSGKIKIVKDEVVDVSTDRGKSLIQELSVQSVPTVIIKGEFNKKVADSVWDANWRKTNNGVIYVQILPPYKNINTNSVIGLVSVIELKDQSCEKCFDFTPFTDFLKSSGVIFADQRSVDASSVEGKSLLTTFDIKKLPSLLVTSNVKEYPQVAHVWEAIKNTEKSDNLVIDPVLPPYKDLETNQVKGLVDVVYLVDSSCSDCYNVTEANKQIFDRFGLVANTEKTVDISSVGGKSLVKQYNITKVPIVILSPEASEYELFSQAWAQVGDTAENGWFIMRNPDLLGKHKDLNTTSS